MRERGNDEEKDAPDWKDKITSIQGWRQVAKKYFMEWGMVWKDVTFGFNDCHYIPIVIKQG